jgi:hypothetical protein
MQIDTSDMTREELIQTYFGIYYMRLKMGLITVRQAEEYVEMLIDTEEFEGCAGIQQAITQHIDEGLSTNADC